MMLVWLVIAHLLGDFYLQSDQMAAKKNQNMNMLICHLVIYSLAMATGFLLFECKVYVVPFLIVVVLHGVIDATKLVFAKYKNHIKSQMKNLVQKSPNIASIIEKCLALPGELFYFIVDQAVHLASLLLVYYCFKLYSMPSPLFVRLFAWEHMRVVSIYTLILAMNWKPVAVLIERQLGTPKKKQESQNGCVQMAFVVKNEKEFTCDVNIKKESPQENDKTGRVIGKLERTMISVLVFANLPEAIGFVLAAKGLARFKQMNDKFFAERFLVGTLTSTLIAMAVAFFLRQFI